MEGDKVGGRDNRTDCGSEGSIECRRDGRKEGERKGRRGGGREAREEWLMCAADVPVDGPHLHAH